MERELEYYNEKGIEELLLGRKVVKIESQTMFLDNGTELVVLPNEG